MVGFTIGTGIGGGVVVDGRLLLGMNGTIGELGHQAIVPDGPPCGCGSHGCLEALAAGPAIARAAGMATPEDVVDAARSGDRRAGAVLEQAGAYLGIGIANVVLTVGPERVVIGGGVAEAGELILRPARDELARRVTVMPLERISVLSAELGTGAGAIGAALWGARIGELAARHRGPA
jgi:glucokinase